LIDIRLIFTERLIKKSEAFASLFLWYAELILRAPSLAVDQKVHHHTVQFPPAFLRWMQAITDCP